MGATGTAPARPTLQRPAKNAAVKRLQRALRDAGFDPGPVDGSFGKRTETAVKKLQKARGLEADGVAGPKTWAALAEGEAAISAAASPAPKGAPRRLSSRGLELIAEFEGFRPDLHNDPAGHASIGFGHLVHRGPINGSEPAEFRKGISRKRARELLRADVAIAEAAVNQAVTVPLTQNQFDALASFTFNVGGGAFRGSTLLKRINAGDHDAVRKELARWNKGGGKVLPGLVRRRSEEADLYERGTTKRGKKLTGQAEGKDAGSTRSVTAAQVRATQKLLNSNGFPCGRVDGEVEARVDGADPAHVGHELTRPRVVEREVERPRLDLPRPDLLPGPLHQAVVCEAEGALIRRVVRDEAAVARDQGQAFSQRAAEPLREAIAEKYRSEHGLVYRKEDVIVSCGAKHSLYNLLQALVNAGDEVLIPSFTFVATANAVVAAGGRPVFVDIKKDDYTVDVSDLKKKITKKSKVVIPVHLYGHPSDMDEISELAEEHSLDVVEDACQSLGSTYKKRQTGTFGVMGCFSMYASKVLTAGEGGAVATDSDELADRLKMIRNHGMVEGYDTRILGLNLRLPELSAAVAKVQMQKLDRMLQLRRRNAELLSKLLFPSAKKHGIRIPEETADKKFNWYLYTVAFQNNRDRIKDMLVRDNVGATVYYSPPAHRTLYYMQVAPETKVPATDWCADHVLSLPVHPHVSEADIDHIASSVKAALEK